jgi:hypothetical protein
MEGLSTIGLIIAILLGALLAIKLIKVAVKTAISLGLIAIVLVGGMALISMLEGDNPSIIGRVIDTSSGIADTTGKVVDTTKDAVDTVKDIKQDVEETVDTVKEFLNKTEKDNKKSNTE